MPTRSASFSRPSNMPKISWLRHNWRHIQSGITTKIFGSDAPIFGRPKNVAPSERMLRWFRSGERQHYGAKSRSPDLFQREDMIFFALESRLAHKPASPPYMYHNLLDAASKVGALEQRIEYTFSDKMTCIEALKLTEVPLYYDGKIYDRGRNNRLALLGDRVLSLAFCETWFHTEHTTKSYSEMEAQTVSRVALEMTGRKLRLDESVLSFSRSGKSARFGSAMAETFEAVLGAVYVDSKYSIPAVKNVLRHVGLVDHQHLKTRAELIEAETSPAVFPAQPASSDSHPRKFIQTSIEPSLKTKEHNEKAAEFASATNSLKKLEPQPQGIARVGKSVTELSSTNALNQASTQTQSSTSMQKELELLKRYAQSKSAGPRKSQRREAALAALHKHALLSKRGIKVRPLELFDTARKGEGYEVAKDEDSATNAPITPEQLDGRALSSRLSLKDKKFLDALEIWARKHIDRDWRKEVARRALQRYRTLRFYGEFMQPVSVFQEIKAEIDIERRLVREPKQQPHESAKATTVEASMLSSQEKITSAESRRHSPTLNASEAQDQDSMNSPNPTAASKTPIDQLSGTTSIALDGDTISAHAQDMSPEQFEKPRGSNVHFVVDPGESVQVRLQAGKGGDAELETPANWAPPPVNDDHHTQPTKLNIPKASKQTTGEPQDRGIFCESEVDMAGFLTFENALPEPSRPSESSDLRTNTPAETNSLSPSQTV
ncbi:hypothetical protein FB567DRAFT_27425 [Paraphoma chrysanthemicola]|uniref:RNase III domain-containing protein n=1 Tax=Paraphoma chrysanthemicola TaxID=798071 RepID=A0A8K0RLG1_9PLEO|nr:hypothetical protein FB567DRAFT_27425 [Paraphoma chrysanthemicola]